MHGRAIMRATITLPVLLLLGYNSSDIYLPTIAHAESLENVSTTTLTSKYRQPFSLAWSGDGSMISAYFNDSNIIEVFRENGTVVNSIERYGDYFHGKALAILDNTKLVSRPFSGSEPNAVISISDIKTGKEIKRIVDGVGQPVRRFHWARAIALTPDQRELAVLAGPVENSEIRFYATDTWRVKSVLRLSALNIRALTYAAYMSYSQDGKSLAVGIGTKLLVVKPADYLSSLVIDVPDMRSTGCCISSVSFGKKSSQILVTSASLGNSICERNCANPQSCCHTIKPANNIYIYQINTKQWSPLRLEVKDAVWSSSSRDQDGLIAFQTRNFVQLVDPLVGKVDVSSGAGESVQFSPDGRYVAVSDLSHVDINRVE